MVRVYALSPFNEHGGYAPKMVEFDTLPPLEGRERFVSYSDYAALEAQLAEVKAERDVAVAAMVRNCDRADAAESRLSTLEATPPAPKVTEAIREFAAKQSSTDTDIQAALGNRSELYFTAPKVTEADGAIRICPMRDSPCPHGMSCKFVGDGPYGYPCKPGWRSPSDLTAAQEAGQ